MTDLEKLRALFTEFGIEFKEALPDRCGGVQVSLYNNGITDKIVGYRDFSTEFYFDMYGDFVNVGIWE